MIRIEAPAKINLLLDIIKRLPNGYHVLFMVMQAVSLYDTIEAEQAESGITLTCSEPTLPTDEKNLAYRAAQAFFESTGIKGGCTLAVTKRIPLQAGLAGGSTDAAGVLRALNLLFDTKLTTEELCRIGVKLGADVPFCLHGGTMLAQDIGQILSPLPRLKDCCIVLAKPTQGVSTGEAYAAFDECKDVRHPDDWGMLHALATEDFDGVVRRVNNVFEQFIEVPERIAIKTVMRRHGSLCCCMSGSGPTVFGLFDEEARAAACVAELKQSFEQVFLTHPVGRFS